MSSKQTVIRQGKVEWVLGVHEKNRGKSKIDCDLRADVYCSWFSGPREFSVRDLSLTGLRLLIPERLEPFQRLLVRLKLPIFEKTKSFTCTVVGSDCNPNGYYATEVAFLELNAHQKSLLRYFFLTQLEIE